MVHDAHTGDGDGGAMAGILSVTPTMVENLPPLGKPLRGKQHVLRFSVDSKEHDYRLPLDYSTLDGVPSDPWMPEFHEQQPCRMAYFRTGTKVHERLLDLGLGVGPLVQVSVVVNGMVTSLGSARLTQAPTLKPDHEEVLT